MDFSQYLVVEKPLFGGVQKIYKFPNGYGASIVRHEHSYGNDLVLWELGVAHFTEDGWDLDYDTDITDDVIGFCTDATVNFYLDRIFRLKNYNPAI